MGSVRARLITTNLEVDRSEESDRTLGKGWGKASSTEEKIHPVGEWNIDSVTKGSKNGGTFNPETQDAPETKRPIYRHEIQDPFMLKLPKYRSLEPDASFQKYLVSNTKTFEFGKTETGGRNERTTTIYFETEPGTKLGEKWKA